MAPSDPTKLSVLDRTKWHKKSHSSLNSDACTFHSARASRGHNSIELEHNPGKVEPRIQSIRMDRSDSGYEDGLPGSRRSSVEQDSSSRRNRRDSPRNSISTSRPQRRSQRSTPSSGSNAPSTRRSTSEWRAGAPRPSLHARHTTPYRTSSQYPQAYFHFPPIALSSTPTENEYSIPVNEPLESPCTPPPATIQYWTSDSTRRLEYAAIDAASKGVRGFMLKMVPDCFLPKSAKRKGFHCDDSTSDAGSVRRYRLNLPEENLDKELQDVHVKDGTPRTRRPMFRRWTTLGGKKKAD